jgi:hypothetical protein
MLYFEEVPRTRLRDLCLLARKGWWKQGHNWKIRSPKINKVLFVLKERLRQLVPNQMAGYDPEFMYGSMPAASLPCSVSSS